MKKEKGANQLEFHAGDYKLVRSFDEIAKKYMSEKVDWSEWLRWNTITSIGET